MKKRIAPSISLRIDYYLLDELDAEVDPSDKNKFQDRSKCIIHYIQEGKEYSHLKKIAKDPAMKKEFDEKMAQLVNVDAISKVFQTMDIETLKVVKLLANDNIEAKYKQLIIDVKKG